MTALPDHETRHWGTLPDGQDVWLFVLRAPNGLTVTLGEYGARLLRVQVPDRQGVAGDVLLGHHDLAAYLTLEDALYFGATVGRVANRIARGRFTLDGTEYRLPINNPPNHLHGGPGGFHSVRWEGALLTSEDGRGVTFHLRRAGSEDGYPGTVDVTARYTLSDEDRLTLDLHATTDAPTPLSLTNHAYWNLADGGAGSVLGHTLTLSASEFLAVDDTAIPAAVLGVEGTLFDFRKSKRLGQDIAAPSAQLQQAGGYDHHFVLSNSGLPNSGAELRRAATLADPVSGRQMELWTTENGVQLYSGNVLGGQVVGWEGARYGRHSAVCLETQQAPDAVNQPALDRLGAGSVIVQPGQTYHTQTQWRFSAGEVGQGGPDRGSNTGGRT